MGISVHSGKHCGNPVFLQEQACSELGCLGVWLSERTSPIAQISSQETMYSESRSWEDGETTQQELRLGHFGSLV